MNNSFNNFTGGCLLLMLLLIVLTVSAFCWEYTINTWLMFFDKEPVFKLWHGFVVSIVPYAGQSAIVVAIFTFILMMFLV